MDLCGLADQEPFTAWLRRSVGRDRIFIEPKLYEPLGATTEPPAVWEVAAFNFVLIKPVHTA
jgi:hypothetical protein